MSHWRYNTGIPEGIITLGTCCEVRRSARHQARFFKPSPRDTAKQPLLVAGLAYCRLTLTVNNNTHISHSADNASPNSLNYLHGLSHCMTGKASRPQSRMQFFSALMLLGPEPGQLTL